MVLVVREFVGTRDPQSAKYTYPDMCAVWYKMTMYFAGLEEDDVTSINA